MTVLIEWIVILTAVILCIAIVAAFVGLLILEIRYVLFGR